MADERLEKTGRPEKAKKPRKPYKPPMGCLTKFILLIVIIAVLLLAAMAIHFNYLKGSNPELTVTDYLTFTWDSTKTTVEGYKQKALEWKEWLAKSEKTLEWLDNMFPDGADDSDTGKVAGTTEESDAETEKKQAGESPDATETDTEIEKKTVSAPAQKTIHPEFRAAAQEFRAGIAYFQKQENNKAYKKFQKAQDHLEAYRQVNPDDPDIEKFEAELAPYIHAAMKDSKLR